MTRKEELQYLLELTSEAAKWQVDEGDNCYELEIKDRMKRLVDELVDPDDVKVTPDQKKDSNAKYRETHCKIRENGKEIWVYKEDCERVVDQKTGREKWVRKQPLSDAIFDIDKL